MVLVGVLFLEEDDLRIEGARVVMTTSLPPIPSLSLESDSNVREDAGRAGTCGSLSESLDKPNFAVSAELPTDEAIAGVREGKDKFSPIPCIVLGGINRNLERLRLITYLRG